MVRVITREDILASELKRELVEVPEWGGAVYVSEMDGVLYDEWEAEIVADRTNARAKTVIRCVVDENGQRLFKDEDVEALGKKSGKALARITDKWRALNKSGETDMEAVKGNSEPGRSDDSASS